MIMLKITTTQTIECKAFIKSAVDCVRLPENLDHKMRIMANLLIDRYLISKGGSAQLSKQSVAT